MKKKGNLELHPLVAPSRVCAISSSTITPGRTELPKHSVVAATDYTTKKIGYFLKKYMLLIYAPYYTLTDDDRFLPHGRGGVERGGGSCPPMGKPSTNLVDNAGMDILTHQSRGVDFSEGCTRFTFFNSDLPCCRKRQKRRERSLHMVDGTRPKRAHMNKP